MAANTNAVFLLTPKTGFTITSTSAVTSFDGTDANVKLLFTASATFGSKIEDVYWQYTGSTGANSPNIRFWINNGSTVATAANNSYLMEFNIPNVTVSQMAVNSPGSVGLMWRANLILPVSYRLYVATTAAITNGIAVTAVGGDY